MEPKIIFEDKYLVVVDKPAGVVVNDAKTVGNVLTIQKWHGERNKIYDLRFTKNNEFLEKSGIVHRLDKDTSGLLVLAKTPEAYENLKQQFLQRKTKKTYIALVHGEMGTEKGIVSLPIERNPKVWGKFMIGKDLSKTAITHWQRDKIYEIRIMNKTEKLSLMEIQPLTGRTHQIRVHMKHLGHPIISDPIYSGRRQYQLDLTWCPRLFLHAWGLEIIHPVKNERMEFSAELPEDLAKAMLKLVN